MRHAVRQIDQIRRRVLDGQKELGLRVCVMEDQYGFFLNHLVVRKSMDVDVVPFVQAAKERFPHLVEMDSCSQTVLSDESYTLGGKHYKRVPAGYDAGHPNAELLLHNGLHAGCSVSPPPELYTCEILDYCMQRYNQLLPLHRRLVDRLP